MYFYYSCISLHDSHLDTKLGHGDAAQAERKWPSPATQVLPRSKTRHRPIKEADKSKVVYCFCVDKKNIKVFI